MQWKESEGIETLVEELGTYFKKYIVATKRSEATEDSIPKTFITFKLLNNEWQVSTDFFMNHDAQKLIAKTTELEYLEAPWILRIKEKDKFMAGEGSWH